MLFGWHLVGCCRLVMTRVMKWGDVDTSPRWLRPDHWHPSCHPWSAHYQGPVNDSDQCLMRMKWQSCKGIFSQVEVSKLVYLWFWFDNVIAFDVTRQSVPLKSLSIYSMPVIIFKTVNPSARPILTVSSNENQRHSCCKWMTYFYLQYGLKGNI